MLCSCERCRSLYCKPVERIQLFHGVGALEGHRVCYRLLAHAAAHLRDEFAFVLLHPPIERVQQVGQAIDTMRQERRGEMALHPVYVRKEGPKWGRIVWQM